MIDNVFNMFPIVKGHSNCHLADIRTKLNPGDGKTFFRFFSPLLFLTVSKVALISHAARQSLLLVQHFVVISIRHGPVRLCQGGLLHQCLVSFHCVMTSATILGNRQQKQVPAECRCPSTSHYL